jgi:predicted RNA-binding Zn-ribbon protein involved in translation (DUF1610 family)
MNQKVLLKFVKTWKINKKPEYRGFRCASCQRYIHKAWHYFLKTAGWRTAVHLCSDCRVDFEPLGKETIYKTFSCDKCGNKIRKAWHCWKKKDRILSESHFCRECGDKLMLGKKRGN